MLTFDYLGEPKTFQKIVPGDTITAIGAEVHTYVERTLAFTSGGTTTIVVGDIIIGATSGAYARVIEVTLASGTWAGGDAAGTFKICSQVGTFQSENIKVQAGTDDATIAANSTVNSIQNKTCAKAALVVVEAQTALVSIHSMKPDQTNNLGIKIESSQSYILTDPNSIRALSVVDAVSGSASTVKIICFF